MKGSRAKAVLGGAHEKTKKAGSKSGHPVHEIRARRAASGGFIVEHHFKHDGAEPHQPMEEHQVSDLDQLKQHMEEHMGDQPDGDAGPGGDPEAAAAAQQAAPPQQVENAG